MTRRLHLDFETRSAAPFGSKGSVGLYRYAEHPTTSVWCLGWRFGNDGLVNCWWRDEPFPAQVIEHVGAGGVIVAHNAPFERRVWNVTLNRMLGGWLPHMSIEQLDCTMSRCVAIALPPDLERAAEICKAAVQKDLEGGEIMERMAKPHKVEFDTDAAREAYARGVDARPLLDELDRSVYAVGDCGHMFVTWLYSVGNRQILTDYNVDDVLAETGVDVTVPALSPSELALWRLNEKINDRGIPIDAPLVEKVQDILEISGRNANRKIWALTGGAVKKCSEHARLRDWLATRGIKAYVIDKEGNERLSVAKGVKDELLAAAGNDMAAREAIDLHNSTAKLAYAGKIGRTLEVKNPDNRLRGLFRYHTAPTGRFSATIWQAHNLERVDVDVELPTLRELIKICERFEVEAAENCIQLITGRTLHWMSKMSRPIIKASPGKVFRGVDLSNIEGRVNAWLAGEHWKLDAFGAFDRKEGPDLYKVTAGSLLAKEVTLITKAERQTLGKVPDLAGGYQGGVGAYVSMGLQLGVKPEEIADVAAQTTDPAVWAATAKMFRPRFSHGLEPEIWTGLKIVVTKWRERHPEIVKSWWDRQDAAIAAVSAPGMVVDACGGRIRYLCQHGFLWCMLPTGRMIAYVSPSIVRVPYIREIKVVVDGVEVIEEVEDYKNAVQVWGLEKNQWVSYTLFGGLQCENDVQAMARDVCFDGGKDLDAFGYFLIFHCHDEWLSEDDPNFGSPQHMAAVLSKPRCYAPDLPLAAAAWEDTRYVK